MGSSSQLDAVPLAVPASFNERRHSRLLRLIYVLIAALLVYAWLPPIKHVISSMIWPAVSVEQRDAHEFMALCYDENSFPEGTSPAVRISDQIESMIAAGFSPIRLQDALGLFASNRPVTAKGVLLTFDFDDLSMYKEIESVLKRTGWFGTAFYCTGPLERGRGDLRTISGMIRSRFWEVGARSHLGTMKLKDPAVDLPVSYMASYRWLADAKRYETIEEFMSRIHKDHQNNLSLYKSKLNYRPEVFAFPLGDYGQLDNGTEEIRQLNQIEVGRHYALAFSRGELALNNKGTNPKRLNRLYVRDSWNGRALMRRIVVDSGGAMAGAHDDMRQNMGAWTPETGHVSMQDSVTDIRTDNLGREATAWYASPALGAEFSASLDFSSEQGEFVVYFKRTETPSTYSRIRFATNSVVVLEQKRALKPPEIIERGEANLHENKINTLDLFLREKRVYARLNGVSVFGHGVELSNVNPGTRFGVGVLPVNGKSASAQIHQVLVRKTHSRTATWDKTELPENLAISWLHENAGRFTHISPPSVLGTKDDELESPDFQSVKTLANVYNMKYMPRVTPAGMKDFVSLNSLAVADTIASRKLDGLFLDLTALAGLQINVLQTWLQSCSGQLEDLRADLLVKLPPSIETFAPVQAIFSDSPRLYLVSNGLASNSQDPGKIVQLERIQEAELSAPVRPGKSEFLLLDQPTSVSMDELQSRIRYLQLQSEKAIAEGEQEKAIVSLSEWHELSPDDSRPITMIADALYFLGYKNESLDFYRQSLDANPGQVKLVARLTEIFSHLKRDEEARNLLNLYVRLFPEDPDILYAQAVWLVGQERPDEAQERLDIILEKRPLDFAALLLRLRTSENTEARIEVLSRLEQIVKDRSRHLDLVDAVQQHDLLTLPHAHIIIDMLEKIAESNPEPKLVDRIQRVLPRYQNVVEDLTEGQLSGNWEISGGKLSGSSRGAQLLTLPSQAEARLKLLRAQRLHDCYVKATFKDVRSSVWIYGRRSINNLVRFGVDAETSEVFLQIWKDKNTRVHAGERKVIDPLPEVLNMRLEIRGNGVMAYLGDEPFTDVPLELGEEVGPGWLAVSVESANRGQASATISALEAGPLPAQIALLPQTPSEERSDLELSQIRSLLGKVSDASPDWFKVDADGNWVSLVDPSDDFFRLFSRYYRIRLVPAVQIAEEAVVHVEDVKRIAKLHGLDGLVLRFEKDPGPDWVKQAENVMTGTGLYVYTLWNSPIEGLSHIRGLGRASLLFDGSRTGENVEMLPADEYTELSADPKRPRKTLLVDVIP